MNVVVAHADPGVLRRFERVLTHVGHDVRVLGSARAAVDECRADPPDVVLVDVELCRDEGQDLLASLKGDPEAYRSAVVLLERPTLDLDAAVGALRGGAQDFLVEPFSDAELVARVDAAGRTKVLKEELVVQSERLEALLFEDPLTKLSNRWRTPCACTCAPRTSSAGSAASCCPTPTRAPRRADEALYEAKRAGRDRVAGAPATVQRRT